MGARPQCPECGKDVDPKKAVPMGKAKKIEDSLLEGIYCCSDCLLDAWKRGYPRRKR
jgi:hypothetical protein